MRKRHTKLDENLAPKQRVVGQVPFSVFQAAEITFFHSEKIRYYVGCITISF